MTKFTSNDTTKVSDVKTSAIFRPEFIQIPDIIARDMRIGWTAKALYGYIYWLAKLKDGKCTAGNNYLGDLVGCSAHMVQQSLAELEKYAMIDRIYTTPDKKIRLEIIPRIIYSVNVSVESDTVSVQNDTNVSVETDQNKNIYNKNTITNVIGAKLDNRNKDLQELIEYADSKQFVLQGTVKMNRNCASNCLKKYGLDKTKRLIQAAVQARGERYAPTINDFCQLYKKAGDLITFYQKENKAKKGVLRV